MSPKGGSGSCQKLQNCVYICLSYTEKNCGLFFPGHGVNNNNNNNNNNNTNNDSDNNNKTLPATQQLSI